MTVKSRYLRDFQRYKLSSFDDDKVDPIAAKTFLDVVEMTFLYMNYPQEYQIHLGVYMMKGEAHFLWKCTQKRIVPREGINSRKPIFVSITH